MASHGTIFQTPAEILAVLSNGNITVGEQKNSQKFTTQLGETRNSLCFHLREKASGTLGSEGMRGKH